MSSAHNNIILEACVENLQQAKQAQANGAHQIELCAHLELDGLSPSPQLIEKCLQQLNIPIKIMVRPEPGPFLANQTIIKQMIAEIHLARKMGVHGIVFGLLDTNKRLDIANIQKLINEAGELEITIHKAIDESIDIYADLSRLNALNHPVHILTSGGAKTAIQGHQTINEMIRLTKANIQIIAAGKITGENLKTHTDLINTHIFHGKKIV